MPRRQPRARSPPPPSRSRRKPWSTTRASSAATLTCPASASSAKAMLSAPPDTPAASRGAGSNGPSGAIAAANSAAVTRRRSAQLLGSCALFDHGTRPLRRCGDRVAQIGPRAWKFGVQLRQRVAGGLFLVDGGQRIGQAQQCVLGVLRPSWRGCRYRRRRSPPAQTAAGRPSPERAGTARRRRAARCGVASTSRAACSAAL